MGAGSDECVANVRKYWWKKGSFSLWTKVISIVPSFFSFFIYVFFSSFLFFGRPVWVCCERNYPRVHPMFFDGKLVAFAPFNSEEVCKDGFIYFSSEVRMIRVVVFFFFFLLALLLLLLLLFIPFNISARTI
jgi:hypothetical protein